MEKELANIRNTIRKDDIPDFILRLTGVNEQSIFVISCIKEELLQLVCSKILSNKKLEQIYEVIAERFDELFISISLNEGNIIWMYIYNMLCELERITCEQELFEASSNLNKFIRISFDVDLNDE